MTPWIDYFDARRLLIHEWSGHGVNAEDIAMRLEVAAEQVDAILRQPLEPLPGCSRAHAIELAGRVKALERELHSIRDTPTLRPVAAVSDVRGLLSNADAAICGCQYWVPGDGLTVAEEHQPGCVFAPRRDNEHGTRMLVISRCKGERLMIGDDIEVVVVDVSRGTVRLAIRAPADVAVLRYELVDAGKPPARE